MTELRARIFIDLLLPKTFSYLVTQTKGNWPATKRSFLMTEVSPALEVEVLADISLKAAGLEPHLTKIDSRNGWLGLFGESAADVRFAAEMISGQIDQESENLGQVKIANLQIVSRIDAGQAQAINRQRTGSLCLPGETLLVLDCIPSPYALLAANEAEKHADVKIISCRFTGSTGRLYLSGADAQIRAAGSGIRQALSQFTG